jgi:acetyltransferase-like isoleucine patch superfamily enzyme
LKDIFIHPTALVETDQIGAGTSIWAYAHIMRGAAIGENCNVGDHCFIERGAVIGNNVTVKNGNMIWEGVTLEDGVFVGPHAFFTNDLYPRSARHPTVNHRAANHDWLVTTRVCEGASLGAGAVIRGGITIGAFAMVGAGAVVTRDVPSHGLVLGNPARLRGWVCRCGLPLSLLPGDAARCKCQLVYKVTDDGVWLIPDQAESFISG